MLLVLFHDAITVFFAAVIMYRSLRTIFLALYDAISRRFTHSSHVKCPSSGFLCVNYDHRVPINNVDNTNIYCVYR